MRILAATLLLAAACGGPQKKESALVQEGSDVPATCCCKTIPDSGEHEIVPNYAMVGRMECSTQHGDCVPDVQCNGSQQVDSTPTPTEGPQKPGGGAPPPPDLGDGTEPKRIP